MWRWLWLCSAAVSGVDARRPSLRGDGALLQQAHGQEAREVGRGEQTVGRGRRWAVAAQWVSGPTAQL